MLLECTNFDCFQSLAGKIFYAGLRKSLTMPVMKIKCLLLFVGLFAFSCSKDQDPSPALESITPIFAQSSAGFHPPSAMTSSHDDYARLAVGYINAANAITSYSSYFQIPAGATKTTTKITATNGRINNSEDFVAYEWLGGQWGDKIALQISEQDDHYTWEIFVKPGQGNYLKYIHAEENKDKSGGSFKIFNIYDINPSSLLLNFAWTRSGDTDKITVIQGNGKVELTVNTKTKAGSLNFYMVNVKLYEMTWDATGNGIWKHFDNGSLTDSGTWTV
jgi:hypothetical protein